jgi:soluble lytic murein transglycosylase-like protein
MFSAIILSAAKAAHVSGILLLAICTHESGLRNIMVPKDGGSPSYGLCMVKFETAKMVGFHGRPKDLMNPMTNAKFAAKYLKFQEKRYGSHDWCKLTASFNSGTYMESSKSPGYPKNLKYVRHVQKKLDDNFKDRLSCDTEVAYK